MATKRKSAGKKPDADREDLGGGILGSLTGFLENLGDLAEAGELLSGKRHGIVLRRKKGWLEW